MASRIRWVAAVAAVGTTIATVAGPLGAPAAPAAAAAASASGSAPRSVVAAAPRLNTDAVASLAHHAARRESDTARHPAGVPTHGRYAFFLKLGPASTLGAFRAARSAGASRQAAARKAQQQAGTARAAQSDVISAVAAMPGVQKVLYRSTSVLDGVAVTAPVSDFRRLRHLDRVAAVYPIAPKTPSTAYSVPFQGAPAAWQGAGSGLGAGVTIVDIDTGLDYTHADFGGAGTSAAYHCAFAHDTEELSAVQAACGADVYDPAKLDAADSEDLVGDTYNADDTGQASDAPYQPVPQPDPNPLDCGTGDGGDGHGTHTAGIAAGYGVKDGKTYSGAYNASTVSIANAASWGIGPGMAPRATLVSYRVFGCSGSSDVVTEAIDNATKLYLAEQAAGKDPHFVINMSLGGDYAAADDADSMAAAAATNAGITVAVASGNDDDVPDIGGSPGDSPKVITAAASSDAFQQDPGTTFTIDGDTRTFLSYGSSAFDWFDDTAPQGGNFTPGTPLVEAPASDSAGCTAFTAAQAAALAGKIVVLSWRQTGDGPQCGSVTAMGHAKDAGALGVVFASNSDDIAYTATGIADLPAVVIDGTDATTIAQALAAGGTVTVGEYDPTAFDNPDNTGNDHLATFPGDPPFSSRGVHAAGDVKPDVAAVGDTVTSAYAGTGFRGIAMSGTSMATPMVAGLAALVEGAHPDWTPEQVKADIMNTADANVTDPDAGGATYAPNRVGSGRIDAASALADSVLAYADDDSGSVSVSFGPVQVPISGHDVTRTSYIAVQNTGDADETYTVGYHAVDTMPGVSYDLSTDQVDAAGHRTPGTVTVPAHTSRRIAVTLDIPDPTQLTKAVDGTYWYTDPKTGLHLDSPDAKRGFPVTTLADASGNLVLTPADGTPSLRVPIYAAPKPVSELTVPGKALLDAHGRGSIRPAGRGVDSAVTASADKRTAADDYYSLGAGFELQATSPAAPSCGAPALDPDAGAMCVSLPEDRGADLRYVGTTSNVPYRKKDQMAYFAITTWGTDSTPAGLNEDDILIDVDGNGKPDLDVSNYVEGYTQETAEPVYVAEITDLKKKDVLEDILPRFAPGLIDAEPGSVDTNLFDTDSIILPVPVSVLKKYGVSAKHPVIHYGVVTTAETSGDVVDAIGATADGKRLTAHQLSMNVLHPGLTVTRSGGPIVPDQQNLPLRVTRTSSYAATGGKGLLFLHLHNAAGHIADVVGLGRERVTLSAAKPVRGRTVSVRVGVTGEAGRPATGRVVLAAAGKRVGTAKLENGHATLRWRPRRAGMVKLTARYGGNAFYAPASVTKRVKVAS